MLIINKLRKNFHLISTIALSTPLTKYKDKLLRNNTAIQSYPQFDGVKLICLGKEFLVLSG